MIATGHFVFVHVHKTGGQSLIRIISRCFPDHEVIGYHYPYPLRPDQYARLPVVAFIRNPWDWYVSWYAFNRRAGSKNALFAVCSDGGRADFSTTVRNLVNLGDDSRSSRQYRRALVSVLPKRLIGNRGIGLTQDCIAGFNESDVGYLSWLFRRMIDGVSKSQLHIGRFETLEQDFRDILERLNVPLNSKLRRAFVHAPHINVSRHGHYSRYYDDELRNLVAAKDVELVSRFGYLFEHDSSSDQALDIPDTYAIDGTFRKLSGSAKNYVLLKSSCDVTTIADGISRVTANEWTQSDREQRYRAHHQTRSLLLIHDADMRHRNPTCHDLFHDFEAALNPILEIIGKYYGGDGYVVRALFANLMPGSAITPHIDFVFSLLHSHRVHVPIVTNDDVVFTVGGEARTMAAGEICEINNATVHGVENRGTEARIHLIVDWAPNSIARVLESRDC